MDPATFSELAWMLVVQSNAITSRTQFSTCRGWYWHVRRLEHWRFWQVVMADFSTFPGSSRLSVLWTHDRRRDRQWIRPDEVTAREQHHHPGVTLPADEIWLLARLQGLPLECGPPPALVRGQGEWWGVCWRWRKSVVRTSPTLLTTGVSTTRDQTALSKWSEIQDEMAQTP